MKLKTLIAGAAMAATMAFSATAQAEDWAPSGPLNLQIGFGAGGETDTLGRIVGKALAEQTGWNVVVENKPGGGGIAMFTGISVAPADGSVIGLGVNIPVIINLIQRGDQLPFTVDSFDYLGTVTNAQLALIAPASAPYNNVDELVAASKKQGGINVAFDAKTQELIMRSINSQSDAGLVPLATKSSSEQIQMILGGQAGAAFTAGNQIPYIESGDVKLLASANETRHNYAPDVPTLIEQGYDVAVDPYFYFAAPKGLPENVKSALVKALDTAIQSDEVKTAVQNALKTDVRNLGPEGTRESFTRGLERFKKLLAN
ncbi:tripartite tricarboxylate transporter substrate binding protein [Aquicoccus sp. G2-2]|uniref:tripartite tricarboxylate transporter substrate binding protein n=1 Tax=Aquicoccus sp. G2-2 TaxID=3092120 RepID=UPI002ADFCD12|nr:tripartite tricarboxylate transporter substrate binding protein [Aquicoccus sp. G2-2]MEA1114817.1 tripartite tricarboxylate transporter substrate binding protein [Aquicoccus sp. G2-2]